MSTLPPGWTPERPSPLPVTPSTTRFRRPEPPSAHNLHGHAPATPSPLSPFSTTPPQSITSFFNAAPPKTPRQPSAFPGSHYYRAPRSAMTSPCRSNCSSPSVSPTRSGRRSRIQALLATDPLLSRLTPTALREMANDPELGFTAEERAWSMRAAEGITRVGEWLREVEGWNIAWGRGSKNGDGYLPPEPGARRKRRKMSLRKDSVEEMRTISEEQSENPVGKFGSYPSGNDPDSPTPGGSSSDLPPVDRMLGELRASRGGKPLTPMQLKLQKRAAAAIAEDSGSPPLPSTPPKPAAARYIQEPLAARTNGSRAPSAPVHSQRLGVREASDEDEEDKTDPDDYYGSLTKMTVGDYEQRIDAITEGVEELDVEGLKGKVLSYRTGIENPLTSSSAVIAATTLQLLPPLHRLMKLLSIWAIRLAVLKIVPVFLRWLGNARDALDAGYEAIRIPAIADGTQKLDEEIFAVMAENIQQRVTAAGRIMDSMLDALEGREDVIPDKWIGELEDIEEGVSCWEMDAERVVLEGRLRDVTKAEEFRNEREKMHLVMEGERVAEKAREDEDAVEDVLEKVGELERGLMEALETQEDVTQGIEIEGPTSESEPEEEPIGLGLDKSLLKRLREVQSSEIEADRGRRWRRSSSIGSLVEAASSSIKSPDMGRLCSDAESKEGAERRSFLDSAVGDRLKEWSMDAKPASPSPTIVVTGFDVPRSPRGTSLKEVSSCSLTKKSEPAVEKEIGPAAAAIALLTSGSPDLGQGQLLPAPRLERSGGAGSPGDLSLMPGVEGAERLMTPLLGLGELSARSPASIVKLAGTSDSVDQEVVVLSLPTHGNAPLVPAVVEEMVIPTTLAAIPESKAEEDKPETVAPEIVREDVVSSASDKFAQSARATASDKHEEEVVTAKSIPSTEELEESDVSATPAEEKALELTLVEGKETIAPVAGTKVVEPAIVAVTGKPAEAKTIDVVEETEEQAREIVTMEKPVVTHVQEEYVILTPTKKTEEQQEAEESVVAPVQEKELEERVAAAPTVEEKAELQADVSPENEVARVSAVGSTEEATEEHLGVCPIEEQEITRVEEQDATCDREIASSLIEEEMAEHQDFVSMEQIAPVEEFMERQPTVARVEGREIDQTKEMTEQREDITETQPEVIPAERQQDMAPVEHLALVQGVTSVKEPMEMQPETVQLEVEAAELQDIARVVEQGSVEITTDKQSEAEEPNIIRAEEKTVEPLIAPAKEKELEEPVIVAAVEEKPEERQYITSAEEGVPAQEISTVEEITHKKREVESIGEHDTAAAKNKVEEQQVIPPVDFVEPDLTSVEEEEEDGGEEEGEHGIIPVKDMDLVEEVKEQEITQGEEKSDGQQVMKAVEPVVSFVDVVGATEEDEDEEAPAIVGSVSSPVATAELSHHMAVGEYTGKIEEAVLRTAPESTLEKTDMPPVPIQVIPEAVVEVESAVTSTEVTPAIGDTVQEVGREENVAGVLEVEKEAVNEEEEPTMESVQPEQIAPATAAAVEQKEAEPTSDPEEVSPAAEEAENKTIGPVAANTPAEAIGIDVSANEETTDTVERVILSEPVVEDVSVVETRTAVADVEETNKPEQQVILPESVETMEKGITPLPPKGKASVLTPAEATETVPVENVLGIQKEPATEAPSIVIDDNNTPSRASEDIIAAPSPRKLSHVRSARLVFEGLVSRPQPAEPVTPSRGASFETRKQASDDTDQDPTVLAIEKAIEEFSRPASGRATPVSDEDEERYTPSPSQLHASLLPSVFDRIFDFGDIGRSADLERELGEAFADIDDEILSDFHRAAEVDDDMNYDASVSSDTAQFHIRSSPPKFELSSPMLPSPRSVNADGGPFTPYRGYGFLNASIPGDDSFTGFDDFEATSLPSVAPPQPSRRNKAHDLPSIMESQTPRSMQEEWGSHAKRFLGGHPMQPNRSKSPSDGRDDGSVKHKSKKGRPARKQLQSLFDTSPPVSEANDDSPNTLPEVDGAHVLLPTSGMRGMWNQTANQPFGLDSSPAGASDISTTEPSFDRGDSPDYDIPTGRSIRLPKRGGARPQQSYIGAATPEKRQQRDRPWLENSTANMQDVPRVPSTPPPRDPDVEMDERINKLLMSLPRKVKLTVSNLQKLNDMAKKPPARPWQSNIPAPESAITSVSSGSQPGHARTNSRRHNTSVQGDIKCYHLHRNDGQPPMKLLVRLVGNARLVCRVGGGWSDLEEYLKEWALHHGSKMRAVSESVLQIEDIPPHKAPSGQPSQPGQRSLPHSGSNSSMGHHKSPTLNGYLRSPTPSYGSRPSSSCGERGKRSASPMFSITAAPRRAISPNVSPMLLPGRPESPSQGSRIGGSLGPSPLFRGPKTPTSDGSSSLGPTPSPPSGPSRPASRGPPSGSRPGSSGSLAGVRRQTSRLSFAESAAEDRPPLGLAGPRGGGKNVTAEHQAWVEGMLGQVRMVSGSRAIYSSANELGGSIGGSPYGGSVFGDEEPQSELRPPLQIRPHTSLGRPQTSLSRPQTTAAAGRRRSGSESNITPPGRRRSSSASLVQAQRELEVTPREHSAKGRDKEMAVSSEEGARALGQIQVPRTRPSMGGTATGETRRVYLKRGDGGAIRGGARRGSRGSSALPRPSSKLE